MRYGAKWPEYAKQWNSMIIKPGRVAEFKRLADFATLHKETYKAIEARTTVPWPLIAVLHRRESDANFTTYLGNGEPLSRKTRLVPKGRGPFKNFIEGAIDALHVDGLDGVKDWRLEKMLYYCELFNGAGYHNRGLPSPYIWGGTNIQKPGKFTETTAGSTFRPTMIDTQPGCAPMLYMIAKNEPTVTFIRET